MMSINRYRLRHRAVAGDKTAQRVFSLLKRPDRLLGVILIGSTFANVFASSIAAVIAVRFFGDLGVAIGGFIISLIILIYSEVMPKTLAALRPEIVAYRSSFMLKWFSCFWLNKNLECSKLIQRRQGRYRARLSRFR